MKQSKNERARLVGELAAELLKSAAEYIRDHAEEIGEALGARGGGKKRSGSAGKRRALNSASKEGSK